MYWVILAILATFFWACTNIFDKILRTKYLKHSIALTASFGIFGLLFSTLLFPFVGIPTIPIQNLVAAFVAGISVTYAIIFYIRALSLEEASRVVPLWHLAPVFTLVLAVIFLNEILTPLKYYGFTLILLGGFLISTRHVETRFHLSPAVVFMLLSSILVATGDVLMKFALSTGIFWQTFFVFYSGVSLGNISLFILPTVRKNFKKIQPLRKNNFIFVLFLSVLAGSSGQILFNNALLTAPVTLLSVFVSFQSLFVLILSTFLSLKFPKLIREHVDVKTVGTKIIAIFLMAAGLFLISI